MDMLIVLPYLQLILAFMNVCVLIFAFYKFLNKPRTNFDERLTIIEHKVEEINRSLLCGNDRFREQDDTNEVMQSCMLALIDFELSYCIHTSYNDTEDLMKAKDKLRGHLSRK